jgi:hypothetical protein
LSRQAEDAKIYAAPRLKAAIFQPIYTSEGLLADEDETQE